MGTLLVRDTTLYFQEAGKGDVILFVHGLGGDANTWDEQVGMLAGEFRCVTYDRRGHTRSPLGNIAQASVEVHADDAAELTCALGLAPAIVVCSDRGAEIGLDLARRYPSLISGAVLSEPLLDSLAPLEAKAFWGPILADVRGASTPRAAVDAFFSATTGESWGRLSEARREAARANHVALRASLMVPPYAVAPADLGAISIPIALVSGARSSPFPRQAAATIVHFLPDAELIRIEEAGHATYLDQPAAFSEVVRAFAHRLTREDVPAR